MHTSLLRRTRLYTCHYSVLAVWCNYVALFSFAVVNIIFDMYWFNLYLYLLFCLCILTFFELIIIIIIIIIIVIVIIIIIIIIIVIIVIIINVINVIIIFLTWLLIDYQLIWVRTCYTFYAYYFFSMIFSTRNKTFQSNPCVGTSVKTWVFHVLQTNPAR